LLDVFEANRIIINKRNYFACAINDSVIRSTAAAIVSSGLAKVGYNYV